MHKHQLLCHRSRNKTLGLTELAAILLAGIIATLAAYSAW